MYENRYCARTKVTINGIFARIISEKTQVPYIHIKISLVTEHGLNILVTFCKTNQEE